MSERAGAAASGPERSGGKTSPPSAARASEPGGTVEFLDRGTDRIGLHVYPLPADDTAPIAVVWPAMGTPARYYRHLASALGEAGLGVVVVDLRGTGASTPKPSRRSRYGYSELTDDVGAVLEALKARLDGRPVYLVGHSLGGQVGLLHLARAGAPTVAGLVLVAVGLPWWRSYGRKALSTLLLTQWIVATATLVGVWPGWGFGGRQARRVIQDWGYTARHGRFPRLDGASDDVEARLAAIGTPVLALSVAADQYTPRATTDHLCAKLTAAPVQRVHLDGPLDHFTWARTPSTVVDEITTFVRFTRPGGA